MDFDQLSPTPPGPAASASDVPASAGPADWDSLSKTPPGEAPDWDSLQTSEDKYGSGSQQAIAGLEGAAKGLAGPAATFAETHLLGVKPEDIQGRADANPWTHGLSEAGGFGAGSFLGTGEAALLGRAGEAVAGAAGLGEAATTGSKLAKAAVTGATEMGLFQAGDELSKSLLNAPQTPGSIASNIGLSALLGGVGGPAFSGLGMLASKALDSTGLKEFTDRLAFRKANIDPNEMMRNEADNVVSTYNDMNSELGGANGLKAQALQKLLPKEITPEIGTQVQELATKSEEAIKQMMKDQVPSRFIGKFENDANQFLQTVTDPAATPSQHFDAINSFKQNLQDYSKGNWGPFAVPRYHEAYDFLNITKNLSRDVRLGLEDSNVWGKAADLQKGLNKSWTNALPAMKDFEKKFMVKVGDQLEISQDKFNTYTRAGLRNGRWNPVAYGTSDRQNILGNFIDAMDNHFGEIDKIYQSAGMENPFPAVGMSTLKETLDKPSIGARLADVWHDKLSANAIGDTAGAGIGAAVGHSLGYGIEGTYLGKNLLGPVFGNMIRPILEKYPNVDLGSFQQAYAMAKAIEKGDSNLAKAAGSIFKGAKTFPSHVIPSDDDLDKLDEKTKNTGDVGQLQNVSGKVGYYMPDHGMSIAKTAGDAVAYLNAQRPVGQKALPLDTTPKIPQSQKAAFKNTLSVAQQPLMLFKNMHDGTLTPQDIQTVKTLYPDYYNKMSEQLLQSLTDHLHDGETVPYKMRQGMSMFLGTPLDSTMTPSAILAAQGVFMAQAQAKQAAPQKGTAKLSKVGDNHMTANEASIQRRNKV